MRRLVPLLLAVAALSFAPAPFLPPKPGTAEADLRALQGEWCLVRLHEYWGRKEFEPGVGGFVIAGDCLTDICADDEPPGLSAKITLNPAKTPKTIDFKDVAGEGHSIGIYRLEGDTLVFCRRYDGKRPADFVVRDYVSLQHYKRKKP